MVAALALFVTAPLWRHWHLHWGATPAEVAAAMPGDELVPVSHLTATRAVTVDAPPAAVWPWLLQVGYLGAVIPTPSPLSASRQQEADDVSTGQAGVAAGPDGIDLYWLPLGAGGHSVRWNGKIYEELAAWRERRPRQDLYHSALEVRHGGRRYVIEMGPVWNEASPNRGIVCEGPVGARWLGRFRAFRYEVRCWAKGRIPDVLIAVDSPQRLSDDPAAVVELLQRTREVPALTWGRDELGAGEMWNSNSLVAWLLAGSGQDMAAITPPAHGRAPGWAAGLQLARREQDSADRRHVPLARTP